MINNYKILFLIIILSSILCTVGCRESNYSSISTSQTQITVSESEPETEPEPEKTSWEIFLERREVQGLTEAAVQEALEELRKGPYIYFHLLTDDEQYLYAEEYVIATQLITPEVWKENSHRSETYYLWDSSESLFTEEFSRVGLAFEWDQPELIYTNYLYLNGSTDIGVTGYVKYNPKYMYSKTSWVNSKKVYDAQMKNLRAAADEMLKDLPESNDYDKARYILEAICKRYTYEQSGPRNLFDIFKENKTQCEGYAKTFVFLAQRAGIEAGYMEGDISPKAGEVLDRGHAWCFVKLDGEYYYIDCTWADNDFGILYYYLGMTTAQMENCGYFEQYPYALAITRNSATKVDPRELLRIPECTAKEDSYMYRSNQIITEFSKSELKKLISGKSKIILFFESPEVGQQCYDYLIKDKNLKSIWKSGYTYYYGAGGFLILKIKK